MTRAGFVVRLHDAKPSPRHYLRYRFPDAPGVANAARGLPAFHGTGPSHPSGRRFLAADDRFDRHRRNRRRSLERIGRPGLMRPSDIGRGGPCSGPSKRSFAIGRGFWRWRSSRTRRCVERRAVERACAAGRFLSLPHGRGSVEATSLALHVRATWIDPSRKRQRCGPSEPQSVSERDRGFQALLHRFDSVVSAPPADRLWTHAQETTVRSRGWPAHPAC